MREQYRLGEHPGRYEGLPPVAVFILEQNRLDIWDGEAESPYGWFGVAGRWLFTQDGQGFYYACRCASRKDASDEFRHLEAAYTRWLCETEGQEQQ